MKDFSQELSTGTEFKHSEEKKTDLEILWWDSTLESNKLRN